MGVKRRRWNPLSAPIGAVPATAPERLFTTEALQRAWLAVKRAGGGKGVAGNNIREFEATKGKELEALRLELIGGTYRPKPVRQIMVPKQSDGLRPIALWAIRDRIAQRVVYDIIVPGFEMTFLPCSYGFRVGLSVQDAVQKLSEYRDKNLRWVVDCDIKNCFDQINVSRLMPLVKERVQDQLLVGYIQGWLDAKIFNSADGVPQKAGVSQGSVLSPLLANIYLHQVDLILMRNSLDGNGSAEGGQAYIRYADDLMFCCRTKQDAQDAFTQVRATLAAWDLTLNERKSNVVHFDEGFSWLGYFFVRRECYRL